MKILVSVMLIVCILTIAGCCSYEIRTEPTYPNSVLGWKERRQQGVRVLGGFVLKKGESTKNGKIKIKIINLIAPDPCAETMSFQRQARAKIQFIDLSTNIILYEGEFAEHGSMNVPFTENQDEIEISTIWVHDINIKDGWVHFEVVG